MRMLLLCGLLDVPCDWAGEPSWSPELFVWPLDPESGGAARVTEHVINSGTHDAYLSLVSGDSDVIVVAREPSDAERAAAEAAGLALEVRPVALDAFVFLVNGGNPIDDLSLDQLRGIYSGQITDWAQLGGPSLPIQPYQRDPTSGSQELMMQLVMKGTPMIEAPDWLVLWAMTGPFTALATDASGIGYSVYYYAEYMQPDSDAVAMIAVEGVLPDAGAIAAGEYPLTAEVYAVIRGGEGGSARAFFDWLLTAEGQQAVAATGYVPLPSG
jgi:phosphate transport system substrate-binding protein